MPSALTGETITPSNFAGLRIEKPQATEAPHLNMLVYGKSSIGKTTFGGSAGAIPDMRKVLLVDVEAGTLSLRNTDYGVDVVHVKNWNEIADLYNALKAGGHDYNTVVLDSLTELQKLNMDAIMLKMLADPDNADRDPDVPSMYEWNKNTTNIRKFVRLFRDLPMNTIFLALLKEDNDKMTGRTSKMPELSGKLAQQVAAFLDIVMFYYIKEVKEQESGETLSYRCLLTRATADTVAKDRSGTLPPVIVVPDLYGSDAVPPMSLVYNTVVSGGKK